MSQVKITGLGRVGQLLAGAAIIALPLTGALGCAGGKDGGGGGGDDTGGVYFYDQAANGRTAYLKTNGGFSGGDADTGTSDSVVDPDKAAIITTGIGNITESKTGPAASPAFAGFGKTTLFGDAGGRRLEVSEIGDVDKDGTSDDAFMMFSHNKPGTEFSLSYGGTRSSVAEIEAIKAKGAGHQATYKGTGEFYTAIGPNTYRHMGDLEMTAKFGGATAGIDGSISNLKQTDGVPVPAPVQFDELAFKGELDESVSPDYQTSDFVHRNNGKDVTTMTSQGAGSFFGANAGGTIGVFSGRGKIINGGSDVNLLGGYYGHTSDNN